MKWAVRPWHRERFMNQLKSFAKNLGLTAAALVLVFALTLGADRILGRFLPDQIGRAHV